MRLGNIPNLHDQRGRSSSPPSFSSSVHAVFSTSYTMSDPTKEETTEVFRVLKGQKANKVGRSRSWSIAINTRDEA
jgi:hypothetical protein